jgi:hypothetical protein
VFFRRQFDLSTQEVLELRSGATKLVARALLDDGAVMHVNDVEMARVNIPSASEKPVRHKACTWLTPTSGFPHETP